VIDPEKLEQQKAAVEAMRVEAERLEAKNRLRAAQLEAVRLGTRLECGCGCGREVSRMIHERRGLHHRCYRREWTRRKRGGLKGLTERQSQATAGLAPAFEGA
jgi:hypothetical protein